MTADKITEFITGRLFSITVQRNDLKKDKGGKSYPKINERPREHFFACSQRGKGRRVRKGGVTYRI